MKVVNMIMKTMMNVILPSTKTNGKILQERLKIIEDGKQSIEESTLIIDDTSKSFRQAKELLINGNNRE